MPSPRKGWANITPKRRRYLQAHGIDQRWYESGKPLAPRMHKGNAFTGHSILALSKRSLSVGGIQAEQHYLALSDRFGINVAFEVLEWQENRKAYYGRLTGSYDRRRKMFDRWSDKQPTYRQVLERAVLREMKRRKNA